MATPVRIFVKRPKPLKDQNIVYITNFTTPFDVDLYQQIGTALPTLIHKAALKPEVVQPPRPEPEPTPAGVIWDSLVDGKWDQARTVDDKFGDVGPNGKGFHMEASGDPKLVVLGNNEADLVCKPGHGRMYAAVNNYNSRLELEFNFKNSGVDNLSLKLRSRHQMGGACDFRFGGFGCAISLTDVDFKTESCHNEHENSISDDLPKKLETGKWYKMKYTCRNTPDNKEVEFIAELDYNDGQGFITVLSGQHNSPKPYYMDKASFDKQSEFWIRMNNEAPGTIGLRNVRLVAL
jgi:hypothetical protein